MHIHSYKVLLDVIIYFDNPFLWCFVSVSFVSFPPLNPRPDGNSNRGNIAAQSARVSSFTLCTVPRNEKKTGWWFQICLMFIPISIYLGKWSHLANIFQMGWNHRLKNYRDWIRWLDTFQFGRRLSCISYIDGRWVEKIVYHFLTWYL